LLLPTSHKPSKLPAIANTNTFYYHICRFTRINILKNPANKTELQHNNNNKR